MTFRPAFAAFILAFAIPAVASAAIAPREVSATWNSNAANADRAGDELGALAVRVASTFFSQRISFGRDDALVVSGAADGELWPRFDGLDRVAAGPRIAWRHKFGLGNLAPTFALEADVDGVLARESARDGFSGALRAVWHRRFETGPEVRVGAELSRHNARADVFDRTAREGFLELTQAVGEAWQISPSVRWRDGDVVSYATPPRPDLVDLARVRTLVDTFDSPRIAYSIRAHTVSGSVTLVRILSEQTSVRCGYEYRDTRRDFLVYQNHLFTAALARAF